MGGAPVGGGTVWLLRGGADADAIVDTAVPNGSGVYTFASCMAGDVVMMQPSGAYSVADAGQFTVNPGFTQNFSLLPVQSGSWIDFQSFDDNADFTSIGSGGTNGCFWDNNVSGGSSNGHDGNIANTGSTSITYDATGGPSSSKSMKYHWDANPTCPGGCSSCDYAMGMSPRINYVGNLCGDWFFRFHEKFSSGFKPGADICSGSGIEYKWCFIDFGIIGSTTGSVPQIQIMLHNGTGGAAVSGAYAFGGKMLDYSAGGSNYYPDFNPAGTSHLPHTGAGGDMPSDYLVGEVPPGAGFDDSYHTVVFGIEGLGQVDEPTLSLWVNGVLGWSFQGPFCPADDVYGRGQPWPDIALLQGNTTDRITVQMGTTINNGPTAAQDRWFREFGIYRSRPSLVAGLAV